MTTEEYMVKVSSVLAEYTQTFAFGEKAMESVSRWAMNWRKAGYDANSVISGLREGMAGKITKKEQVGQHYHHLTDLIRAYRSSEVDNNKPQFGCHLCSGGWVTVPHPMYVAGMQWSEQAIAMDYFPTCNAFCNCALGKYKSDTEPATEINGRNVKMMRLASYEDYVADNWHDLMRQRVSLMAAKHIKVQADLKSSQPVISDVRRGPLPEAVSDMRVTVTNVVANVAPTPTSKPASQPAKRVENKPALAPQGNEFF